MNIPPLDEVTLVFAFFIRRLGFSMLSQLEKSAMNKLNKQDQLYVFAGGYVSTDLR